MYNLMIILLTIASLFIPIVPLHANTDKLTDERLWNLAKNHYEENRFLDATIYLFAYKQRGVGSAARTTKVMKALAYSREQVDSDLNHTSENLDRCIRGEAIITFRRNPEHPSKPPLRTRLPAGIYKEIPKIESQQNKLK